MAVDSDGLAIVLSERRLYASLIDLRTCAGYDIAVCVTIMTAGPAFALVKAIVRGT